MAGPADVLVFATSDKGGTGRSVTISNVAYRHALNGGDSCYLDFDFGSPTAGAIFELPEALVGVPGGGLHSHIIHGTPAPPAIDIWARSERHAMRGRPTGAGRLVLYPGDLGGGEFQPDKDAVSRCVDLLMRADTEHDLCVIDLSAGRSYATEIALAATADPTLAGIESRWLIFHRWTCQHIIAASGLVRGHKGILETGAQLGHEIAVLSDSIRYVRTTVAGPQTLNLRSEQVAWRDVADRQLQELATRSGLKKSLTLAEVPLDPVLLWQEQLLTDEDVHLHRTANEATVDAFRRLAGVLVDGDSGRRL